MDYGVSSIFRSSEDYIAEIEKAALADLDRFDKEADEELKGAFHKFAAENEHESEEETDSESEDETVSESGGEDDRERNLHTERSFVSEEDEYSAFFAANPILHRNNGDYENELEKGDSYNGIYDSSSLRHSHSVSNSHVSDEDDFSSTTGQRSQNSAKPNYPIGKLKEEYQKLYILYKATLQELTQLKAVEMNYKKEAHNTIKTMRLNLDLLENEKDKLGHNLQDSQNLISDYEHGKNKLGEVMALKSQLSSICKIKDEIQRTLESSKVTIYSLEKQLNKLNRADHLSQHCDHNNSILEEMKLHHEKDILSYKQNIDQLQSKLNSKMEEAEDLALKNSELQKKYQQLEIEKNEWVNKMSEVSVAQKNCQLLLESGTIEEINRLKLQVQHLEEEKSNIERENSLLKESFLQRWARSLLIWQLHGLRRVNDMIDLLFF
ncbi:hypothetical protein AVEN_36594-1 [Araneus ventricosus]|uniref:Uncharacterized protein n=1 Tax=Araneus ventricosus TaxID=182803 RepID=A0A4Y2PKB6_ARAVE|nr:hypothetical protein AVEN_36594-1 [Araneus ventricosus]